MPPTPHALTAPPAETRLHDIAQARRLVMAEGRELPPQVLGAQRAWIERSWRRCLQRGRRPEERVEFDCVPRSALKASEERHHELLAVAAPLLDELARAIARTRYFAILTDAQGMVIDVRGAADRGDRRVRNIARVGVDLSEASIGTSAIGAALGELQPVWLHRGEHFYRDTSAYSCAGAPLFGPDGHCAGMLDLTGVDALERPELADLAAQAARRIENALVLARPQALSLRLNWPGHDLGGESDALLGLDADGWIVAANRAARALLPQLAGLGAPVHAGEVFALAPQRLFEHARASELLDTGPMELALWSGLLVQLRARRPGQEGRGPLASARSRMSLQQLEDALVRQAVASARGNVAEAARALGVSRATVYRKLGGRTPRPDKPS
ncbi:MAG: histidine kinase [Betaproteobacteria bacterium]|nr:histidine kinase [Betaproteobacteria bacterium]